MGTEISRWADRAQYVSEHATSNAPTVTLLSATKDPFGELASLCAMYVGRVVRSMGELTDDDRRKAWDDMMKTELQGPLESVQFHFLVENVTRDWTHQAVRTRQQFVAQESLRFAVVEDWGDRVPLPPSIMAGTEAADIFASAIAATGNAYDALVNSGIPAEDARSLMPHGITTRLHFVMSLRTLLHQSGLRLCTQAQFQWRVVMAGMVNAIRAYGREDAPGMPEGIRRRYLGTDHTGTGWLDERWQWDAIADTLKPVCYQTGRCTMSSSMDRGCTIRERVDANATMSRPSSEWHEEKTLWPAEVVMLGMPLFPWVKRVNGERTGYDMNIIPAISPAEWALDSTAARVKPDA